MKWKEEQYGRYKGGGPSLSVEQQVILEKLAINVPTDKEKKNVQGPWEDPHKWSKYTEEGTLLDDFNSVDLERKIKEALVAHEELRALVSAQPRALCSHLFVFGSHRLIRSFAKGSTYSDEAAEV